MRRKCRVPINFDRGRNNIFSSIGVQSPLHGHFGIVPQACFGLLNFKLNLFFDKMLEIKLDCVWTTYFGCSGS